uniref:Mucin-1 n=1 Tax=Varanus komodoensis TaxID=61221 RepID=A0A8D2JE84_VARKO
MPRSFTSELFHSSWHSIVFPAGHEGLRRRRYISHKGLVLVHCPPLLLPLPFPIPPFPLLQGSVCVRPLHLILTTSLRGRLGCESVTHQEHHAGTRTWISRVPISCSNHCPTLPFPLTLGMTGTSSSPVAVKFSQSSSSSDTVPGWGIALLVLVAFLVLIALILIRWCFRNRRDSMDLLGSRDSYHSMNEYPTYHTHGRYLAPSSSKPNPYNQVSGKGGLEPRVGRCPRQGPPGVAPHVT